MDEKDRICYFFPLFGTDWPSSQLMHPNYINGSFQLSLTFQCDAKQCETFTPSSAVPVTVVEYTRTYGRSALPRASVRAQVGQQ